MRNAIIAALMVLGFAAASSAQTTAAPTSKLAWEITDANQAQAQASTYKGYFDVAAPVALTGVVCVAGTPVTCTSTIPALTQGDHVVAVTRTAFINNTWVESAKSNSVSFTMLLIAAVQNLHIEPSNP